MTALNIFENRYMPELDISERIPDLLGTVTFSKACLPGNAGTNFHLQQSYYAQSRSHIHVLLYWPIRQNRI